MKFFSAIGHFFSSLFGGSGSTVQKVLHGVSSFVNLAAPIVAELAAITPTASGPGFISQVAKVLSLFETDATKVQAWVGSVAGLSDADILRTAATTALSALVPAGALASELNLAVELAYSVYKAMRPAPPPLTLSGQALLSVGTINLAAAPEPPVPA